MARGNKAAPVPVADELRCRRSDGREWRCPRRAMAGVSFCEYHYHLARRNQAKHKELLESASKPHRKPGLPPRPRPKPPDQPPRKRRRKGDPPTKELTAVALRRRMERREEREMKKGESEGQTELTRDLPNGVMTISLTPARDSGNAGPPLDRKLGCDQEPFLRRYIRSKNVEPLPVGPLKKFPCGKGLRRGRKRICHRCGESKVVRKVWCSSRRKESCSSCIKKWYSEMSEVGVKISRPNCCGYCDCKTCMHAGAKAGGCKEFSTGQTNFIQIKYAYNLINQLLPVLKQISQEQITELEIEANNQGRRLSGVQIQVAERGPNEILYCNHCKNSIIDFLRSCPRCPYKLCLSCCQEIRGANILKKVAVATLKFRNERKANKHAGKILNGLKQKLSVRMSPDMSSLSTKLLLPEWKSENSEGHIACPSKELGGCGNGLMHLVFMLPFNWSEESDISAEQIAVSCKRARSLCCIGCSGD
ncbi:uncharacterized protein LOC103714750 isoform X2 [Phoenix dactylifera]|uniref:Uncharacterized protein LOC103714750 isoform X2 n=1 Tax=Phoenix dactylifera TaxID=42345 RepID=A0A8B9ALT8_PHODC|nr:uncharacterized protein LOC103714750 isoform X2 [Phoenix dactylifera]